jgi:APA family basic amino acid/polyamine antiporter
VRAGGTSQAKPLSLAGAWAFIAWWWAVSRCSKGIPMEGPRKLIAPDTSLVVPIVLGAAGRDQHLRRRASPVYFAEEFEHPAQDLPRSLIGGGDGAGVVSADQRRPARNVLSAAGRWRNRRCRPPMPPPCCWAAGVVITAIALVAWLGLINTVGDGRPRILYGLRARPWAAAVRAAQGEPGRHPDHRPADHRPDAAWCWCWPDRSERLLGIGFLVRSPWSGLAALIELRLGEPQLQRPFRCWGYPDPAVGGIGVAGFSGGLAAERSGTARRPWASPPLGHRYLARPAAPLMNRQASSRPAGAEVAGEGDHGRSAAGWRE